MKAFEKLFDFLGEVLAIALVVVYIVALANAQWGFITNATVLNIIKIAITYGSLLLVAVVGMEAVSKHHPVIRFIFYACVAIIVVFMFFPDTYNNLIGIIK